MGDVVDAGFSGQSVEPVDGDRGDGDTGPIALPRTFAQLRDRIAGGLLIVGAGLAIGGSFAALDRAVEQIGGGGGRGLTQTATTTPWHYQVVAPGPGSPVPRVVLDIGQYFGIALAAGGLVALLFGLLLVTGQARLRPAIRPAAAAAGALLVGATLATVMVVLGDEQFDNVPAQTVSVTTPQLGFWLVAAAGAVALVTVPLLLVRVDGFATPVAAAAADEPETPPYGLSVIALPPSAPEEPAEHPEKRG